ncbi:MAG: phosphatidylglycerol lysyltransferase domain-containing protein, partial [Lachnospiraceae bacterium]|nr:phosphatidylglycerol lysyltransferase domain-containing protein [Lachnospiraceae bacterium]
MITFRPITIDDRDWMSEKLREDNRQGCEYSFANNFIWSVIYKVEVAEVCGCCIVKYDAEGEDCYAFPIGAGDKKAAIMQLLAHAKEDNSKLYIESIEEADREFLEEHFSGIFQIEENRDSFDYIYTVDKLTNLSGKKLHGKRNHIARFKDDEDWSYEPMTAENKQECYDMNLKWCDR